MHRLCAPRPLLERPVGRPAEREQRQRAEIVGERADDAAAEAVEGVIQAVVRFGTCHERAPAITPGHAGEHDRANTGERALALTVLEEERAARNEACALDRGKDSPDRRRALGHRGFPAGLACAALSAR